MSLSPKLRVPALLAAALLSLALPRAACAVEPWSDPDPPAPPQRFAFGDYGFRGGAEYRAQWLGITPIALASDSHPNAGWIEHRLRLDLTVDYLDKVRVITSIDALDGVLWGDNGTIGDTPAPDHGTHVGAKNPNVAVPCLRQVGSDPLSRDSYAYGFCGQSPLNVRRLYGEVLTPVGLLRVGRQPVSIGNTIQAASGDGRPNRFGMSRAGNSVDRILFGTKPFEAWKPKEERNLSPTEGAFFVLAYDRLVTGDPQNHDQATQQTVVALRVAEPTYPLGRDLEALLYYVYRWDQTYHTRIHALGVRGISRFGPVLAGFEGATNLGSTREVSEAYRVINNDPVVDQTVRQFGARAVLRYDLWPGDGARSGPPPAEAGARADLPVFTGYLEFDYASGSSNPEARAPLTQFIFAEDSNVGLLLFPHVLAYQTGRAAAAGVETLRRLGAVSFPAETINTRGAFTNAIAFFPQMDVRPHPQVLLRGGVLFAWADAPVNDPIASLEARDGTSIQSDLVNFAGGKPARYYGTEFDGRAQWRYLERFFFDLEGALLLPGAALQNRDARAVRSVLLQARTTFAF